MPKDKITPPGWYEAEEDQRVVFFESRNRREDLWSSAAWLNGVVFSGLMCIGLTLFELLLIWIRG